MPSDDRRKIAVVLFNLGGPDRPEAIRPFLLNLFRDPAILRVPRLVRMILARVIAHARVKPATENYALLDGRSPLLELTRAQADALRDALPELRVRCFIAMRYWHPFGDAAARAVRAWQPDHVVLLPLYPQFSTTTTGSSFTDWHESAAKSGLVAATSAICCYASDPAYINSIVRLVRSAYLDARDRLSPGISLRVLFSAHGLPESIVKQGDPYQWQVEQTVACVLSAWHDAELDWVICYQSRATPQQWLEPSTISEIERAAQDKTAVLLVPIAFVSEHSETLVELDIEYRHLADRLNVPGYFVAPTPGIQPAFMSALARLVRHALQAGPGLCSHAGSRVCPASGKSCPHRGTPGEMSPPAVR